MNYYYYYDKILSCSENIRTLIKYEGEIDYTRLLFLDVLPFRIYNKNATSNLVIVEYSNFIEISISSNLVYRIHKCERKIQVFTNDISYVEDSIINLPQSVLAFNENNILLHCSSVLINKNIFCFMGNKGVGKTTFSLILSERFKLFSDDTLLLNFLHSKEIVGIPPNTKSKLTLHTINEFEDLIREKSTFLLNSQKNICDIVNTYFGDRSNEYTLKYVFVLNRNEHRRQGLFPIQTESAKKLFLTKNIVGSQYYPFEFCKKIQESVLFKTLVNDVKMYEMNLPNTIEELKHQKNKYFELLELLGRLR